MLWTPLASQRRTTRNPLGLTNPLRDFGWSGIAGTISQYADEGCTRFLLHRPFGEHGDGKMTLDARLLHQEAGLQPAAYDDAAIQGLCQYADARGLELIAYFGDAGHLHDPVRALAAMHPWAGNASIAIDHSGNADGDELQLVEQIRRYQSHKNRTLYVEPASDRPWFQPCVMLERRYQHQPESAKNHPEVVRIVRNGDASSIDEIKSFVASCHEHEHVACVGGRWWHAAADIANELKGSTQ